MPREFSEDPAQDKPLETGMAVCGEYLVPGGSHLVQGDLKGAAIHGALGLAASMLFGFPLRLLVSANSLRTALSRPVVAPATEAEDTPTFEATAPPEAEAIHTPVAGAAETPVVEPPVAEAAHEAPKPVAAVTKVSAPPARRSTPLRKTAVKTQAKAAAPNPKSAAATPKKKARARSTKSTT